MNRLEEAAALASLVETHAKLVQQLGRDHAATKAVESQITKLSGAPDEAPQELPQEGQCNCAGCQLVAYLVEGNGDVVEILRALWTEAEGNVEEFDARFQSVMEEAKSILTADDLPKAQRLGGLFRGLSLIGALTEFAESTPDFQQAVSKKKLESRESDGSELPPELREAMLAQAPADVREAIAKGANVRFIQADGPEDMLELLKQLEASGATKH